MAAISGSWTTRKFVSESESSIVYSDSKLSLPTNSMLASGQTGATAKLIYTEVMTVAASGSPSNEAVMLTV